MGELLSSLRDLGCNMQPHLDFFPGNLGAFSDEYGERFRQDITRTEKRYSGKWNPDMLADNYLCGRPTEEYKRQKTIK